MRALARYIARFFSPILCFATSFPAPFFLPYYPSFLRCCFSFFLAPHQVSNHLPFEYISLTNLSSTPLHHWIQSRFIPPKLIFILLDSLACPKINITIYYMLHACSVHAARCTKTCIVFVGPWRIKGEEDDLFLSPNRFHLSCPSRYKVPFSYINTMSSLNFLPRGLCRQNNESSCGANRRTRYDC